MPTNYPASLDSFTNPTASDPPNNPSHAGQHANANDAIEAIQATLGVDPQGSEATVSARIAALEGGGGGVSFAEIATNGSTAISADLSAFGTSAAITVGAALTATAGVTVQNGGSTQAVSVALRLLTSPGGATVATSPTHTLTATTNESAIVSVAHVFSGVTPGDHTVVILLSRAGFAGPVVQAVSGSVIY